MAIHLKAPSGYVKHLSLHAKTEGGGGWGRWVPICGRDRGAYWDPHLTIDPEVWDLPICQRCKAVAVELVDQVQLDAYLKANQIRPPGEQANTHTGEDSA